MSSDDTKLQPLGAPERRPRANLAKIDIRKLDQARSDVDEWIAELVLKTGCNRFDAISALIRELEFDPKVVQQGGWYFASAWTSAERKRANRIYLRRGCFTAAVYEINVLRGRVCIAYTFEDSVLALLCKLIDSQLDLSLAPFEPPDRVECRFPDDSDDPLADYVTTSWILRDDGVLDSE